MVGPRTRTAAAAQMTSAQASWSNETVWNMALLPTSSGVTAMAASTWARPPPPSSRVTAAVTTIVAAPASEAMVRSPTSESPARTRPSAASNGVSDGKSTKPGTRWRPASA